MRPDSTHSTHLLHELIVRARVGGNRKRVLWVLFDVKPQVKPIRMEQRPAMAHRQPEKETSQ
jgi:hypothetical protein